MKGQIVENTAEVFANSFVGNPSLGVRPMVGKVAGKREPCSVKSHHSLRYMPLMDKLTQAVQAVRHATFLGQISFRIAAVAVMRVTDQCPEFSCCPDESLLTEGTALVNGHSTTYKTKELGVASNTQMTWTVPNLILNKI